MEKLSNKAIIDKTRKLVVEGNYSEAYNYITVNRKFKKGQEETVHCLRHLLACVTGNKNLTVEHFDNQMGKNESEFDKDLFLRMESNIICRDVIFKDLIRICKEKLEKNI